MTELKIELAKALVEFQSVVTVIPKNKTAKIKTKTGMDYSYNYADLADIWEAIREPLKSNGLAVTQFLQSGETTDFIVTKIWHKSGQTEKEAFAIPTNGKTPQEVGSVVTYYKRYALGAALGISTEEDDDGKSGNNKPTPRMTDVPKERNTGIAQPLNQPDELTRAKAAINDELVNQGYMQADTKRAFISKVLEKETIDTIDDANAIMDALENNA